MLSPMVIVLYAMFGKRSIAKISTGRMPIYEVAHGLPYDLDALVVEVVSLPRALLTVQHPRLKRVDVLLCVLRVGLEAQRSLVL